MPHIGQRNSSGSSRPRSTSTSTDNNDSASQDDLLDSSIDDKHPLPFRRHVRKPAGTGAKKFYGWAYQIANVMIAIAMRGLCGWRVRRRANPHRCCNASSLENQSALSTLQANDLFRLLAPMALADAEDCPQRA